MTRSVPRVEAACGVALGTSLDDPCIEHFSPDPDLAQTAFLLGAQGIKVKQGLEALKRQLDLPPAAGEHEHRGAIPCLGATVVNTMTQPASNRGASRGGCPGAGRAANLVRSPPARATTPGD